MPKETNVLKLLLAIVICEAAGILGSLFTASAIPTWYVLLVKPSFSPPSWLFGPVWVVLYMLMGISLYIIWERGFKKPQVKKAITLFTIQLIFNAAWSLIFFGLHNISLAFIEIIAMWILIVAVIFKFLKIEKIAAYLLIPYLIWVTFASYLNFSIWRLNP